MAVLEESRRAPVINFSTLTSIELHQSMSGGWASLGLLPELVQTIEDEFRWGLPTGIQGACRDLRCVCRDSILTGTTNDV